MIHIILSILLVILIIIITLFIISLKVHNKLFNHRFEKNEYVKYYTYEEFNLNETKIDIKVNKETIKGFIYTSNYYDSNKIVIYTHGFFSNHYAYMQDIAYLARYYIVISFDILGVSESSGKNLKCFANATKSLDYVINYVKNNYKNKEIYLIGHSWGAYATLSALKYHKDIKKVVAISGFISRKNAIKSLIKSHKILIPFIHIIDSLKCIKYSLVNIITNLKRYRGNVLIISSIDDSVINYKENTLYLKNKFKDFNYIIETNKSHNPQYKKESVDRLNVFLNNINKLKGSELINYMKNTNYHLLGELDNNIMDNIVEFIKE